MANSLGNYIVQIFANEALIYLRKNLGLAARAYRAYEEERNSEREKGDTINVRKPSTFTAQDAPSSAQDVVSNKIPIVVNNWREVKFKLTDKDIAFAANTGGLPEPLIRDHLGPAAYTLADDIDQKLAALYKDIPWFYDLNATPGSVVTDVTKTRKVLFDNAVPLGDEMNMHFMVNGAMESELLGLTAFAQFQGSGPSGEEAQLRGQIGRRYGMGFFASQNVQSHTKGTASTGTLALVGAHARGAETVTMDAGTVTGTLVAGDSFVIAGNSQRYSVTATSTASTNTFTNVAITPALVTAYSDNDAVTVSLDDHVANLAFHRNAFALAMARLPEYSTLGGDRGTFIREVADPESGLSIRARLYLMPDVSEQRVALDVLYGVKTLDPNLACRARG